MSQDQSQPVPHGAAVVVVLQSQVVVVVVGSDVVVVVVVVVDVQLTLGVSCLGTQNV